VNDRLHLWIKYLAVAARSLSRVPHYTFLTVATLALAIRGSARHHSPTSSGVPDELCVQFAEQAALQGIATYGLFQSTSRTDQQVERLFGARATASLFTCRETSVS
jgi:hypothetical protein